MKLPDDLLSQLGDQIQTLKHSAEAHGDDFKKNVKGLLQAQLSSLDVVTREEFDSQQRVLLKTRQQLAELEERLAKLESAE